MKIDMLIKNGKVVIPKVGVKETDIAIRKGKIVGLLQSGLNVAANTVVDAEGKYVLPGFIEPHVHFGIGEGDKDYLTETKSAAYGGITTVLTYLIDKNDYHELFRRTREVGEKQSFIDFSTHFCLTSQEQLNNLSRYINEYGVSSFKLFMNFKGEEGEYFGVRGIDDGFIFECLCALGKYRNTPACVHAENIEIGWLLRRKIKEAGRADLLAWEEHRPDYVEAEAIRRAMYFGEITNCPIYIVHVTSKKGLNEIKEYRDCRYGKVYAETCTHYLELTSDSELGVLGKISPPLRYREDVESLWQGVANGTIDTVGSDHGPRKKAQKTGNIWEASGGYPGVATLLPILLSDGVNKRGIAIQRIVEMTYNVAQIFNLYPRKGTIEIGTDGDLTIVDLNLEKEVRWNDLHSCSDFTIYEGWRLKGWPVYTIVRGNIVMENGEIKGEPGYGEFIPRFQ